ncbi:UNVERIFIED_ORG: aminotransferase class I and II family protein [Clostridioides difficile F501]
MYYANENLVKLNRVFDQNRRAGFLRLDLNENPAGLPQKFIDEVLETVTPEMVSQYPETLEFTEFLAQQLGTDVSHLSLVNGSSEGIRHVVEAFTSPGGSIVGVSPSYAMFEVYSKMYDRRFVPVHYADDLGMTVEDIAVQLNNDVQLLILVNPNNPMGNAYDDSEMEYILAEAERREITVLIDEAYHYFYSGTSIDYALRREHVFVTRTFSKLFSLAGCRLGYVAGWPEGIELVQKLNTPHNVNMFAMLFAKAIMENEGMLEDMIAEQLAGRAYLLERLRENGYVFVGSEGNFLFIKPFSDAKELVKRMKAERSILIKEYNGIGSLGSCLRVSTGPQECMERFMEALLDLDER